MFTTSYCVSTQIVLIFFELCYKLLCYVRGHLIYGARQEHRFDQLKSKAETSYDWINKVKEACKNPTSFEVVNVKYALF